MKKTIIDLAMLIFLINLALAIPAIPTEYYGTVTIYDVNSTPLPSGTIINVYANNISCGTFTIVNEGYYGLLSCLGDDSYTSADEGASYGQSILFYINSDLASTTGDTVWYYGEYHNVNLTPIPTCNNGWCELTESCITCAEDCGLCPRETNGTGGGGGAGGGGTPGGGGGGGGASGGSGGGGGGGSGSGSGGSGDLTGYVGGKTTIDQSLTYCQEDWYCTAWNPEICPIEETQTRECNDKKNCNTELLKPDVNQTCTYKGTCFDHITNQDETDVDCGGYLCEPCNLNKACIVDTDCKSGYCDPVENICKEPTCNDGYKNQNEEGIDCGGVCPSCERPTLEKPSTIARFLSKGCGPFPWLFVILASLLTLGIYAIGKYHIKKKKETKEFKKLRKVEQLIKLYELNRNLNALTLIVILLEIAISLYLYYFCEVGIWIMIMILLIVPLIIATIIKYYVYDEKRKKKKLHELLLRHEDALRKLIDIERREITKEESKLRKKLEVLDYKKLDTDISVVLKDIIYIIRQLEETKEQNPFELENSLADTISQLETSKDKFEGNEELAILYSDMRLIENIRRSILVHFKELNEDKKIEKDIDKIKSKEEEKIDVSDDANNNENSKPKSEESKDSDKENKTKSIETFIDEAKINNNEESADSLFKIAAKSHREGRLDEAEKKYKEALELNPLHKESLYYLASLYNQQKRSNDSLKLYEKIVGIDPGYQHAKEYYEKLKLIKT